MSAKENNLSTIVNLIRVVMFLRGLSSTGESYLFSTKWCYWEDQPFECPKRQLDYLDFRVQRFETENYLKLHLHTTDYLSNAVSHSNELKSFFFTPKLSFWVFLSLHIWDSILYPYQPKSQNPIWTMNCQKPFFLREQRKEVRFFCINSQRSIS